MDSTTGLAADGRSLDRLKLQASKDPQAATRAAAAQFESLFMHQLLKSMRQAMPKSGLMDGQSTQMYTEMMDQQLAQKMSGRPGGLADVIARQLSRNMGVPADQVQVDVSQASLKMPVRPVAYPATGMSNQVAAAAAARAGTDGKVNEKQAEFVNRMWAHAASVQRQTGVPAHYIVGQAALESGWGRREIRHPDGSTSHNLFGIKAGKDWQGKTVDVTTTEYVGGRPQRVVQRFRAYDSYAESFQDWASLMQGRERYSGVMRASASGSISQYAQGMQKAGYATDPNYANKLEQVIHKAIALRRTVI